MKFNLTKYILPSVVSMILVGTYTNIDGFFIGSATGDAGLAAINFAWPIVAMITSVGTGIGVGGAVAVNHLRGNRQAAQAEAAKTAALLLLGVFGIAVTLLSLLIDSPLLRCMGAEAQALTYAENYAAVISAGALFQIMGAGLLVLLRNEGKTVHAMLYTMAGLAVHIALDFLLVDKFKLFGVAASTVVSQLVVAALCLCSFPFARETSGLRAYGSGILKSAVAPFGLNFVPSAVLLFTNYFAMRAGGTQMVSAYAVMSYAVYTYDYLCQGVCDGIQPVVSYCQGAGDFAQKKRAVSAAACVLTVAACGFAALTPLLTAFLPEIFSVSAKTAAYMRRGLIIYAFSYPLKAAVKLVCSYFYSVRELWISNILTYLDPLAFTPLLLAGLACLCGEDGIWLSLPLSQAAIMLTFALLLPIWRRKQSRRGQPPMPENERSSYDQGTL